MPLPLIPAALAGLALVVGGFGVKKGVDAYSDNKEADSLRRKATRKFDKAQTNLEQAKAKCNSQLETLGQLRLELLQQRIGRFVSLYREISGSDVRVQDLKQLGQLGAISFSKDELDEMQVQSSAASEVLAAGVSTLSSGVLAAMGSYGAVTMFASASTGTAISTISGVAATNATLAWFGGGSLAAGGLGIAGGTAVLGGIVAAPVLAVGGMLLAAKARENLAHARRNLAEAEEHVSEMKAARAILKAIIEVAGQFQDILKRLDGRLTLVLDDLEAVIESERKRKRWWRWLPWKSHNINFKSLPEPDQHTVHCAAQFAQMLKYVLDEPLLTEEGALSGRAGQVLADGMDLIRQHEEGPDGTVTTEGVALLEQGEDDGP